MSGGPTFCKRKKKRKTRAERNQILSQHMVQGQEKCSDVKTGKKQNSSQEKTTSVYTLRSGKGRGSFPTMKDYKQETAATITKERLIVPRPALKLAKTKQSDWIKRGPPESQSVKKKVDLDMKKMMTIANQICHGEPIACPIQVDDEIASPETDVQIQDLGPASISPPELNRVGNIERGPLQGNSVAMQAVSTPLNTAEPSPDDSGFSAASQRSVALDEDMESKESIASLAESLLKEPRSNCYNVFEKRDYGLECRRDIQSYMHNSKCDSLAEDSKLFELYSKARRLPQFDEYDPPSALSSCRAFPVREQDDGDILMQSTKDGEPVFVLGTQSCLGDENAIFSPASTIEYDLDSVQDMEPTFMICMDPLDLGEKGGSKQLGLLRYSAFVYPAVHNKHGNGASEHIDQQKLHQPKTHALNKHKRPFCFGDGDSHRSDGIFQRRKQPHFIALDQCQQFEVANELEISELAFLNGKEETEKKNLTFLPRLTDDRMIDISMSQRKLDMDVDTSRSLQNLDSTLDISRSQLDTALEAACQKSEPSFISIRNPVSLPQENIETDMNIFPSACEIKSSSKKLYCFSELHTHQEDLQRQAHDFLEILSSHPPADMKKDVNLSSGLVLRPTLYPGGSPDSNGSPVFQASSVLKGMSL